MIIRVLNIDGFGLIHDLEIADLPEDLVTFQQVLSR